MGKPTICIGENKDADQLRGNCEADQRLCFRYTDSTIPLLLKSEISTSSLLLCLYNSVCVGPVRKPHCWFSHEAAHIKSYLFQEEVTVHKKKREYRKRKHKASVTTREVNQNVNAQPLYTNDIGMLPPEIFSSDEEPFSPVSTVQTLVLRFRCATPV